MNEKTDQTVCILSAAIRRYHQTMKYGKKKSNRGKGPNGDKHK